MKPKYYITEMQRSGSINGFEVDDYRITAKTEDDVKKIEEGDLFKSGRIKPYTSKTPVGEKSFLDGIFSAEEQETLKELLTPAEIKDAIDLLLRGKKEAKPPDPPSNKEITIDTFTANELKDKLSEMKIEFKGNADKKTLFALYEKALKNSK